MIKNIQRNPFIALCEVASQNNWCWNINCTTCGHGAFKVSFSKIARGQHPDDDSFWPYGKENHSPLKEMDDYGDFFRNIRNTSIENQMDLASIVAEAKLSDIQAVAKFPDWLGYIGLVITHCPSHDAQKIISDAFLPQFIALVKYKKLSEYLKEKQTKDKYLSIADLDMIERSMLLKNYMEDKIDKLDILEHQDMPEGFFKKMWGYFYLFFLYIGIPLIIFFLIKWDPITDYNNIDGSLRPMSTFLVLAWMPFLYNFRKNRALVKSLQEKNRNMKNNNVSENIDKQNKTDHTPLITIGNEIVVDKISQKFFIVPQTKEEIEQNRKKIEELRAKGLLQKYEKTFQIQKDGTVVEEE